VQPRLAAHDIDQEIKECAVGAAGALLAHCADVGKVRASAGAVRIASIIGRTLRACSAVVQVIATAAGASGARRATRSSLRAGAARMRVA
jgi:hypothetical protein